MDTPENYYAILGVPIDADSDTVKRAYRQLARHFHPDLAGPDGAIEMKRINRAYAVLSDPEKRRSYDTIIGGVIDLRRAGKAHPRPVDPLRDAEFSGLAIFSTQGPWKAGPAIHSTLGVISALGCIPTVQGLLVAAGSLDGKGMIWQIANGQIGTPISFASDPAITIESLRELRFSKAGALLAGWGRVGLHLWDACNGACLWSYPLLERAVSAHYSLDLSIEVTPADRLVHLALPHLAEDVQGPRAWGVRGTDVVIRDLAATNGTQSGLINPVTCVEERIEKRQFWAIRLRALSQDAQQLVTLSCAHVPDEAQEMAIIRRWSLPPRAQQIGKLRPQIVSSILVGRCADCTPPYAVTPDAGTLAFVYAGNQLRICDTTTGTYTEVLSGTMGSSSRLAISPDAQWIAVAREDSEVNEGVIDLWSIHTGQVVQKLYHPWQISALYFVEKQLVVALTDGTIQIWE